jgi:hypothetical protein
MGLELARVARARIDVADSERAAERAQDVLLQRAATISSSAGLGGVSVITPTRAIWRKVWYMAYCPQRS